jgi:phosphoglycolate phosphatase-like HAD superfamily hydrolase
MLLLFDIDGTLLLKAHPEHRDALHASMHDVYGIADPSAPHVEAAGRTDLEIARHIALLSGVSAERFDERLDEFREACVEHYAQLAPFDLRHTVAPGMLDLLADVFNRDGVRLSLVTGNLEPIARIKLERAGIGHYFERGQGGFGSDHEDRAELPAIARRRAGEDGEPYPNRHTVVIGDTPRDIACARADGCRALAVATGPFSAGELTAADAVAENAASLGPLIDALTPARS